MGDRLRDTEEYGSRFLGRSQYSVFDKGSQDNANKHKH